MDVPELLCRAACHVPVVAKGEAGTTVADANEYLGHDEWEIALDLLVELGDAYSSEIAFWDLLAEAARMMWLPWTERWCHWRRAEVVHGVVRADLQLVDPDVAGGRRTPIPGDGRLRPLWDIGDVTAAGDPDLYVARLWVESQPDLQPGGRAVVRLAPLSPQRWRRLAAGDVITMHEQMPVVATATIIEAVLPVGDDRKA
ncbi:hypothetical protein GA0070606_0701 [Micromonospora citrea]|uniref:Uncharacterized protein n=1 Tax=Micromonospora citrea TaxID=47855 RepID=A0A1C6TUG6_9ACTN|nr:hypothetical protein [Micromonospora citrea]SCL45318.1 hypothetical protein GA0070606_0701 [Micromonospora citrea]